MNEIILKYLNGEASSEEVSALESWLNDEDNRETYKKWVRLHTRLNQYYLKTDLTAARNNIEQSITAATEERAGVVYLWKRLAGVAAVFVLALIGVVGFYLTKGEEELLLPDDQIVVQNGSGKVYSIKEEATDSIFNNSGEFLAASGAGKLSYEPNGLEKNDGESEEQRISVPRGKKLQVELADGSLVYMNSDSEIRFNSNLVNNGKREVFLAGEAYFDITHKDGIPFVVHSGKMSVQVLGTEFDVKNYSDDEVSEVVLVDGKVKVSASDHAGKIRTVDLLPGMRASLEKENPGSEIKIDEIDTGSFISWMNGEYKFRNTSLSNIIKVLERSYNVDIELGDERLAARKYNATIRSDDIYKTLDFFKFTLELEYTIEDNKIIFE